MGNLITKKIDEKTFLSIVGEESLNYIPASCGGDYEKEKETGIFLHLCTCTACKGKIDVEICEGRTCWFALLYTFQEKALKKAFLEM